MRIVNMVPFESIVEAQKNMDGVAHVTPVFTSTQLNKLTGKEIFFKCENLQKGGSFKIRGAYTAISRLVKKQTVKGVITFSSGNHAQGVALSAQLLGLKCVVVMPVDTSPSKRNATRNYGAEIVLKGLSSKDRKEEAEKLSELKEYTIIHPYDNEDVIAGQGTVAAEFLDQVADLDTLLVPIGGGGLVAGCLVAAKAINPKIKVIGVQSEISNSAFRSFKEGKRVEIPYPRTVADGMRNLIIGELNWKIIKKHIDDVILVTDEEIMKSVKIILQYTKLLVEPSGAVTSAAIFYDKLPKDSHKVGSILCGGNIDYQVLSEIATKAI